MDVEDALVDPFDEEDVDQDLEWISKASLNRDDGNEIGLLQRCKNAGIYDPELPQSRLATAVPLLTFDIWL